VARIAVVGSVAWDEVVRLRTPMRVGTHLEGARCGTRLGGGAACTAVPLAHAGHQVSIVGAIGEDESGDRLLAGLAASGVDTAQIRRTPGASSRSIVMVDGAGERTIVNVTRAREPGPPERLLALAADCVYVRTRALGLAPLLAQKVRSCLVVAGMPPCDVGERPAHILVASAADLDHEALATPWETGRRAAGEVLEWVVITQGERGVVAFGASEKLSVPAQTVAAVDTTGSGDAFASGLVHALMAGAPMRQALETGVAWGAESARSQSSILPAEAVARLLRPSGACASRGTPASPPGPRTIS
jgi:sugar/nucleoside kinase (ribokinase family)